MKQNHPTIAKIDLEAIRRNTERICNHCKSAEIMAVVKADAYGHGAVKVAETVLKGGATRLAVAHLREAVALRQAGITVPIQVFGGFFEDHMADFAKFELEFTIGTLQQMELLENFSANRDYQPPVHIKFDTGMGRIGFPWQQAESVFALLKKNGAFALTGLMTHFATSDEENKDYAFTQLERFQRIISQAEAAGLQFRYIHAANSGAILDMPEAYFNLVRPGVILYGNYPSQETSESIPLAPAMSLHSKILQIKYLQAGESVSYGATWRAEKDTVVAVVPMGYADGYLRGLSGKIHAVINGRRVPQIGRVCMDLSMFDLGPKATAEVGDEVILLGCQGDKSVTMQDFCSALETIPYEITCQITKRIPRVYTKG